jgi:hypothetical protein
MRHLPHSHTSRPLSTALSDWLHRRCQGGSEFIPFKLFRFSFRMRAEARWLEVIVLHATR